MAMLLRIWATFSPVNRRTSPFRVRINYLGFNECVSAYNCSLTCTLSVLCLNIPQSEAFMIMCNLKLTATHCYDFCWSILTSAGKYVAIVSREIGWLFKNIKIWTDEQIVKMLAASLRRETLWLLPLINNWPLVGKVTFRSGCDWLGLLTLHHFRTWNITAASSQAEPR